MRLRGDVGLVGLSAKASTSDSFASQEAGAVLQIKEGRFSLWEQCLQPDGDAITKRCALLPSSQCRNQGAVPYCNQAPTL